MTTNNTDTAVSVVTLEFAGRVVETEELIAALPAESQAALRQFSLERTMGYGVDYADAIELRARVLAGQSWQSAATRLAHTCQERAGAATPTSGTPTRGAYLRRASALLRMSQMMMLTDSSERRAIFVEAKVLYDQAAALLGDRLPIAIDSAGGALAGWFIPAAADTAQASVIVIGGVEGWGMDFESMGDALAARGIDALMLDGPGQGVSRLAHRHFLTADWRQAYTAAIDLLERRAPGRPIGIIGNSMGGSFAMAVATEDTRIRACVSNGGIIAPWMVPPQGTFFSKMTAFCGEATETEDALNVWNTVTPARHGPNAGYPLLMVQGGRDPLVSMEMAQMLFAAAPTDDKRMVAFSDGDHCIYNHKSDRDALVSDWIAARLGGDARAAFPF